MAWEDDRPSGYDEDERPEDEPESSQDRIYRDMFEPWTPEPIDGHAA